MTGACKGSSQVVNDYLRLFVNRLAYTLQSMRPHLGERAALLLPAHQQGNRRTALADARNHSPAFRGRNHGGPVRHQPIDTAL